MTVKVGGAFKAASLLHGSRSLVRRYLYGLSIDRTHLWRTHKLNKTGRHDEMTQSEGEVGTIKASRGQSMTERLARYFGRSMI